MLNYGDLSARRNLSFALRLKKPKVNPMTGTIQRCSPCVTRTYPGFGGILFGTAFPTAPPPNSALNWQFNDTANCQTYWWTANGRSWQR
jgi:hypothetical protein